MRYLIQHITALWLTPQLRDDEGHRQASWLELFFDLAFVAAIAELSSMLAHDISWKNFVSFMMLYGPIWWVWVGTTVYSDRFERDDISHRLFTFLLMIPVAGFAITAHSGLEQSSSGFALCYIAARTILIFLWLRAGYYNPVLRPVSNRYAIGFSLAISLWILSLWVPTPGRFVLWIVAMCIDVIAPLTTLRLQDINLPKFSDSHLPERFGLFTIIILGESVFGVVHGVAEVHDPTLQTLLCVLLGLLLAFCLWWVYFDDIMGHQAVPRTPWSVVWIYGHLFLSMAMTATGAGILNAVSTDIHTVSHNVRWLLCGSIAVSLLLIAVIEEAHERGVNHHDHGNHRQCSFIRVVGAIAAILVAIIGANWGPNFILLALILLMIVQIWEGIRVRHHHSHHH